MPADLTPLTPAELAEAIVTVEAYVLDLEEFVDDEDQEMAECAEDDARAIRIVLAAVRAQAALLERAGEAIRRLDPNVHPAAVVTLRTIRAEIEAMKGGKDA